VQPNDLQLWNYAKFLITNLLTDKILGTGQCPADTLSTGQLEHFKKKRKITIFPPSTNIFDD